MNRFELHIQGISLPYGKITEPGVRKIIRSAAAAAGLNGVSASFVLCSNKFISSINRDFRAKDYPTDVISFAEMDMPFPASGKIQYLGEIYISLDKAVEQAAEYSVDVRDEMKRLIVHGLLHLMGYDHERSKKDEKIMFAKEEEILRAI